MLIGKRLLNNKQFVLELTRTFFKKHKQLPNLLKTKND